MVAGLHNAIRERRIFPVLFASGLGNIGADALLDFLVDYAARAGGARNGAGRSRRRQRRAAQAQGRRQRAGFALRLQDRQRSLLRAHYLLQGVFRRAEERRLGAELTRAIRPEKFAHLSIMQGKNAVAGQRAACRRHRRGGQAERHVDRRHAGRQGGAHPVSDGEAARAGHHLRHRAQDARRRRQAGRRPHQADGRRRHAALLPRSADAGVPDRRHRPAAHRGGGLQAEEPLPHRGQPARRPRCPIARPSAATPTCRDATRSRPAATASSATARSRWSRCRAAGSSSSSTTSSAAPSPRTTSRPWKRESSRRPSAASWPATRWSTSR